MSFEPHNRRVLLRRRPNGRLAADDYEIASEAIGDPEDGDALVRTALLAIDPVTRVMLGADIKVMPPIPLDAAIRGFGVGTVTASRRDDLPVGARVGGFFEWADFQRVGAVPRAQRLPDEVSFGEALNLYGHTAHAAYFGMIDVGRVREGDTVLVTGASGAVGSVAAQIAKIKGARVIGTAGTPAKAAWLTGDIGLDAAIDYRSQDFDAELSRLAPGGLNVIFDNVGGPLLDRLVPHVAPGGRIVLCGAMAQYLGDDPLASTLDEDEVAARGATATRFNAMDYAERLMDASAEMTGWQADGRLKVATSTIRGLEHAPAALNSLFEDREPGRLLVAVDANEGIDTAAAR